ncbi:carbohydrate ABC transporter permease [Butyrivibrio sp. INlla21]|uniref:carbohydrate ABC transporter permease n=1 Tax=Butyrivibrio sp. INlla21 TaxID=1520811 RepID=UPI0008F1AFE7|nr:carbohydrate ABC transporter permease [Butyrivibrio sp. INlla21]SFU93906.1 raffinose/stachyose/melibiose transport system permease protein [Butyrivibrio sp. INlla21]
MMKRKDKKTLLFVITAFVLILFMVPFFVLINNTFKPTPEFIKTPFALPKNFTLENYSIAIKRMDFWKALSNTAIITVLTVIFNMFIGSMTGYLFARKKWKLNKIVFGMFLASMVAPFQVYMIPLVKIYAGVFGLSNNLLMVVYIAVGLNLPFAVFLYKGFTEGIPEELDEAARIDGCGFALTFFRIIMPLLKPIIITVTVFVAMGVWNDYLMSSLFLTKSHSKTLAIAIKTFLTNHSAEYSPMMAGLLLGILPVLAFYLIGQKYIIEGVVAGSVKG